MRYSSSSWRTVYMYTSLHVGCTVQSGGITLKEDMFVERVPSSDYDEW